MANESSVAGQIRPLTPEDIPAIAGLFQKSFRDANRAVPQALEPYLRTLFLEHPWREPDLTSRVYIGADGRVGGFIGILPARMKLNGQPLRAGIAGSLMVEDPQHNPLAGARLLRSFLDGPQDLSFSETANPVSQRMWERLGGKSIPAYSMEWVRVLKPAAFAVAVGSNWSRAVSLFRPVAGLADRMIEYSAHYPLRLPDPDARRTSDADVDNEELVAVIPEFLQDFALHPDWTPDVLRWFLQHAAVKERHGQLHRRIVYDKGRRVGCYLYYTRARGLAWVLQLLAHRDAVDVVVGNLLAHAQKQGSIAVRGRTQPELTDSLLRHQCVFVHRSSTVVQSRKAEVMATIRSGDALLIGLAGETWTQLIGGFLS